MAKCGSVLPLLLASIASSGSIEVDSTHMRPPLYDADLDSGTLGTYPICTYATAKGITSPQTNFVQWSEKCEDGRLYMITPKGDAVSNPGPMILDARGDLVWAGRFDNDFGGQAYNLMMQQYCGEDYLTFWLGDDGIRGHGSGYYYMLNSSYDVVHKLDAANGQFADLHDFVITPEGTALLTVYEVVPRNLSAFRTFDAENPDDQDPHYIWDCLFQEIKIDSGEVILEWRASEHVALNQTYHSIGSSGTKDDPFDWFHINSVEKDVSGNYLISARFTHSISYIDGRTGDVLWTLGGKANDFMDLDGGLAINFAWQHDARLHPSDMFPSIYKSQIARPGHVTKLLTLFDNAAADQDYNYGLPFSRGLLLEASYPAVAHRSNKRRFVLNIDNLTSVDAQKVSETNNWKSVDYSVAVIQSWNNSNGVRSSSQGGLQVLPPTTTQGTKILVGYGLNAVFTEYDANGSVLCDAHFGANTSWEHGDIQSYRTHKFAWIGQPRTSPSIVMNEDETAVLVSWNGATEVATWVVQKSDSNSEAVGAWKDIARLPKAGFETTITLPRDSVATLQYVRVLALDAAGNLLPRGISFPVHRSILAQYLSLANEQLPTTLKHASPLVFTKSILAFVVVLYLEFELYRWLRRRWLGRRAPRIEGAGLLWHEERQEM